MQSGKRAAALCRLLSGGRAGFSAKRVSDSIKLSERAPHLYNYTFLDSPILKTRNPKAYYKHIARAPPLSQPLQSALTDTYNSLISNRLLLNDLLRTKGIQYLVSSQRAGDFIISPLVKSYGELQKLVDL